MSIFLHLDTDALISGIATANPLLLTEAGGYLLKGTGSIYNGFRKDLSDNGKFVIEASMERYYDFDDDE
jgi:hypothetical protein